MPNRQAPDPNANVNVIFHGLFLFVQNRQSIDVLIPNMGEDHVCRAGTFLVEEVLDSRPIASPYFLRGITGGNFRFQNDLNIIFGADYDHAASADDVYARIVLPTPVEIVSLRPTHHALDADVDPNRLVTGKQPCGLQILRYQAVDLNLAASDTVSLIPHPALLVAHPPQAPAFLNLHIFNEEDHEVPDGHAINGFDRTLQLLPSLRGAIHLRADTRLELLQRDTFRTWGFTDIETLDTRERQQILGQAGYLWRDGNAAPSRVIAGVNGSPQDCLQMVSDSGN
jgi:hypothetical protein